MYKRRVVRRKRTVRKVNKVAKLSKPMKKAIVQVLHKQQEDKYAAIFPGQGGVVNPGAPWSGIAGAPIFMTPNILNNPGLSTCHPLLPSIVQGVAAFQRIGDKITPKSLVVKFSITVNPAVVSVEDLVCRLFVLSDKSLKDTSQIVSSPVNPGTPIETELFDNGDGLYVGFVGKPRDITMRVNKSRYTVHHDRLIRIVKGQGDLGNIPNTYQGSMTFASSAMSHELTLRVPLPKTLTYAQNNFQYPSNSAPFWCLGFVQPSGDGTANQVVSLNNHILVNYTSHFDYEDS